MDIKRPGTPYAFITDEQAAAHDAMPAKPCLSHKEMRYQRRIERLNIPRGGTASVYTDPPWVVVMRRVPHPDDQVPTVWERIKSFIWG